MATTAEISILSTISGASEGGTDLINIHITNTSAVYSISHTTLATNGITGASTFTLPTGARQVLIVPPSTNAASMRIGNSTADSTGHLALSSVDASLFSVTTALSTVVLWTTNTSGAPNVRVVIL